MSNNSITEEKERWIEKIRKSSGVYTKQEIVLEHSVDKSVLDVGCVGQALGKDSDAWVHRRVKEKAASIVGVDVDVDGISELNSQGYCIYRPEELESKNCSFDLILILDVIEHVGDPQHFLEQYSKYLKPGGTMLVSTPNSHRAIDFLTILFSNYYRLNREHTCWYCPATFLELVYRSNTLKPTKFWWVRNKEIENSATMKSKFLHVLEKLLYSIRRQFSPAFIMELENRSAHG